MHLVSANNIIGSTALFLCARFTRKSVSDTEITECANACVFVCVYMCIACVHKVTCQHAAWLRNQCTTNIHMLCAAAAAALCWPIMSTWDDWRPRCGSTDCYIVPLVLYCVCIHWIEMSRVSVYVTEYECECACMCACSVARILWKGRQTDLSLRVCADVLRYLARFIRYIV